jgi:hypothetical protein
MNFGDLQCAAVAASEKNLGKNSKTEHHDFSMLSNVREASSGRVFERSRENLSRSERSDSAREPAKILQRTEIHSKRLIQQKYNLKHISNSPCLVDVRRSTWHYENGVFRSVAARAFFLPRSRAKRHGIGARGRAVASRARSASAPEASAKARIWGAGSCYPLVWDRIYNAQDYTAY